VSAAAARVVIFTDDPGWHGRRLVAACSTRGLAASYCSLAACAVDLDVAPHGLDLDAGGATLPAAAFVRGVPGGSLEAITLRLDFLHHLAALGVPVMNSASAIERTVDKARTSLLLRQHGVPTPPTVVSESLARAERFVAQALGAGHVVVKKPMFGSQGRGLRLIKACADLGFLMPGEVAYLQHYIGPLAGPYQDTRVMVIGGRAVAAMDRISTQWITNRAQGAQCRARPLDAELQRLACAASAAVGADYAGVDLLRAVDGRWYVTEVNGIPAWQGLEQACGIDIAALLVERLHSRVSAS